MRTGASISSCSIMPTTATSRRWSRPCGRTRTGCVRPGRAAPRRSMSMRRTRSTAAQSTTGPRTRGGAHDGRILEKVRRHHQDGAVQALIEHLDAVLERSLAVAEDKPEHVAEQMGEAGKLPQRRPRPDVRLCR